MSKNVYLELDDVLLIGDATVRLIKKSGRKAVLNVSAPADVRIVHTRELSSNSQIKAANETRRV